MGKEMLVEIVVHLLDEEKLAMGQQLAQMELEVKRLEDEKSAVQSKYAATIKEKSAALRETATVLNRGFRLEAHEAFLDIDIANKRKLYKDPKTGRILKDEPLEPGDYQGDIVW